MLKILIPLFFINVFCFGQIAFSQPKTSSYLSSIFSSNKEAVFNEIISKPELYRCQIIYTQINRDKNNRPHFNNYYFNYDPQLYFNPASTVKMPLAFLSLEKLHKMATYGVQKFTLVQIDSSKPWQKTGYKDSTSESNLPSLAHFIKKAFLVSDNDAYNRMYQFLGQQYINQNLHHKGYKDVRITRQFMGLTPEQNRHTNAFRFIHKDGSVIYLQPSAYNTDSFDFSHTIKIGNGYFDKNDSLINAPFDFTKHNNISLEDLQQMLQSVMFPASVARKKRFNISEDDRQFLLQYLSQFPSETNFPRYDSATFFNSYVKFYFYDSSHQMPANIRVFNKVGWAYGFMTDVSYIADFTNQIEYMISATLYINSDGILNDNKYDYETKGYPFFRSLGRHIYNYELNRQKKFKPDLSAFHINYEQRNKTSKSPSIKEVDN